MWQKLALALALALSAATGFASDATARTVSVRFTQPDAQGVTTFRIYLRQSGQSYGAPAWQGLPTPVSGVYTAQITAPDGVTVYATGTAVNASGESVLSNEITLAAPAPVCGNAVVETGETCDDGNKVSGDGCSSTCTIEPVCGNGILQTGEACDDGNKLSGDGCSSTCTIEPVCGNGVLQAGEACDDGNKISGDGCSSTCTIEPVCGNGILQAGEACDDGNKLSGDGCSSTCTIEPVCGNGILQTGEQCDDGNKLSGDGCRANCTREVCGDGIRDAAEACDDGNKLSGDGCSSTCTIERTPACGDGVLDTGEVCDDGNKISGDGCRADCTREVCGDARLDPAEQCDDGNATNGDGCRSDCTFEACGDRRLDPGEECDDGNTAVRDGCDATCQLEPPVCGDGRQDTGEACDDGNTVSGDGCSATCTVEASSVIPLYVNVGGPNYTDPAGHVWISDAAFTSDGNPGTPATPAIAYTNLDPMYWARRYGSATGTPVTLQLPVAEPAQYVVRLHFAETTDEVYMRNQRVFSVLLDDAILVKDVDVLKELGNYKPLVRQASVYIADGVLTVRLMPKVGRPMLSGVEIYRASDVPNLTSPSGPKIVGCGRRCR